MGLLQRFARPEFRSGSASEPPPDEEHAERATESDRGTENASPAGGTAADGAAREGGGSVNGPEGLTGEVDSPRDAATATAQSVPPPPAPAAQPVAAAEPQPKHAEVIAFANQKGGVAKTTTTLNLAVAFAETGHRVLAVDMDPQGNLTMSQGIDPDTVDKSMYDVLVNDLSIREVIRKREIDVACASIDLAGAEIAMSTKIGRERQLEKALRAVREDYDFVCIDTPPSLGLLTINALTAADKVIVPVQCEYLSMRGLIQLQNTLSMIRDELNPDVEIEGILPTLVDSRTVHAKEAIEILEENFGDRVFATRIRKTIRFAEAPVKGTSVLKYDPDGVAAESYRDLAKEVLANGRR
jgi:chromosome partitioning protein